MKKSYSRSAFRQTILLVFFIVFLIIAIFSFYQYYNFSDGFKTWDFSIYIVMFPLAFVLFVFLGIMLITPRLSIYEGKRSQFLIINFWYGRVDLYLKDISEFKYVSEKNAIIISLSTLSGYTNVDFLAGIVAFKNSIKNNYNFIFIQKDFKRPIKEIYEEVNTVLEKYKNK